MEIVFEVIGKSGRKIRLTKKQWDHIRRDYFEIKNEELLKETILFPTIIKKPYSGTKTYFYKYYKNREKMKYTLVIIKYLNGSGFVITAFNVNKIK